MKRAMGLMSACILSAVCGAGQTLYVSSYNNSTAVYYDGSTGAQRGVFDAGLGASQGITIGPDSNVYVASHNTGQILKYSPTGRLLGPFTSVDHPTGIAFGPDGNIYVVSYNTRNVIRFNGSTGALIGTFVPGTFVPNSGRHCLRAYIRCRGQPVRGEFLRIPGDQIHLDGRSCWRVCQW